jgi:hypothetical protein
MNNEQTVRGYRVLGERKPEKQYSYDNLMLKAEASHALIALTAKVAEVGANCLNREEEFRGDALMTDGEAQLACAGCPAFTECDIFRRLGHPAWGTWAATVQGRALEEIEREERENDGHL